MKKTLALILALVMVMALVACGGGGSTTSSTGSSSEHKVGTDITDANQQGQTGPQEGVEYLEDLIIAMQGKTTTMDPQVVSNLHHDTLFKMSHNSLVNYNWNTKEMEPELAKEWSVSDDGLTWTFKLRDDVVFHNGEKFEADDVVFTFERGKATGVSGKTTYEQIASLKAVDATTVEMTLTQANADWLFMMMYPNASILNREAVEKDEAAGAEIGTGGWKVVDWENGSHTKFERFDESWVWIENPLTPTKTINFKTMTESSASAVATQTGEVHLNNSVELIDIGVLEKDPNLVTATLNVDTIYFLGFNNEVGPTTDVNLRKAISYAVDPQEILDAYFEGYGNLCETLWGPNQFGIYTDYSDPLETNIEKAKEYLAKSAYPNGVELKLVTITKFEDFAALVQAQLDKIGIKCTIESVDSQGLNAVCKAKEYDFFLYNKSCGPHGDQFRTLLTYGHNTNRAHFNSPRVMELLDLAVVENDNAKRLEMYKEIQQITHDEMPYRPMFYGTNGYAWNKNVSGMIWAGDNKHDYTFLVCAK